MGGKEDAGLVRDACAGAGIGPAAIGFVEAHALAQALYANRPAESPLAIGSMTTNLAHLETAAGVAGLIKTVLVLKHGETPPVAAARWARGISRMNAVGERAVATLADIGITDFVMSRFHLCEILWLCCRRA